MKEKDLRFGDKKIVKSITFDYVLVLKYDLKDDCKCLSRQHEQNFFGLFASSAFKIKRSPSTISLCMSLSLSNI